MELKTNLTSEPTIKIFPYTFCVENELPFLLNELYDCYHIDELGNKEYIVIDEMLKHIIFTDTIEDFLPIV